jgi:hypothetical protein
MKNIFALMVLHVLTFTPLKSQIDTNLTFSGYIDVYYSYDCNEPKNQTKPGFLYNHTRHNEFNLNIGFIKANYTTSRVRSNLALMAGTYAEANLAAEPPLLKHLYEANAGIKVLKQHSLWLDIGIFTSHIGCESAISKDCWTLTRSLVAENSPYYESGAKLTYTSKNEKWLLSALYLNGWQRIRRPASNNAPCFGSQILFKPNDKLQINYSTFFGSDAPDSARVMRMYHDVYIIWQPIEKFGITIYADYGMQQVAKDSSLYRSWYSPVIKLRYSVTDKFFIAARAEYFDDFYEVMIPTGTPNGFQVFGTSLNVDYSPFKNVHCRLEGRVLRSSDAIFNYYGRSVNENYFITSSIAIAF